MPNDLSEIHDSSFDTFWRVHALELKADVVRARNERDAILDILVKLADGYRQNERLPMIRTLQKLGFNTRQVAAILRLSRPTIYNILKEEECREILQIEQPEKASA